jgi:TusA-related sulfurtransferase
MVKIVGKITGKSVQDGTSQTGNPYKKATFEIDGKKYSTFLNAKNTEIINSLNSGDMVEVEYEQNGLYKNIKSIVKATANFTTADQAQDPSVWVKKDLRSAMQTGVNNAVEIIKLIGVPEGTTKEDILEIVKEIAVSIKDIIYSLEEEKEEFPKVEEEFQDY